MENRFKKEDSEKTKSEFTSRYAAALEDDDALKAAEIQAEYVESMSKSQHRPDPQANAQQETYIPQGGTREALAANFTQKYREYTNDPATGTIASDLIQKTNQELNERYASEIRDGKIDEQHFFNLLDHEVNRKIQENNGSMSGMQTTAGVGGYSQQVSHSAPLSAPNEALVKRLFDNGRFKTMQEGREYFKNNK